MRPFNSSKASCRFHALMAICVDASAIRKLHLHHVLEKLENVLADRSMEPGPYARGNTSHSRFPSLIHFPIHPFIHSPIH